MGKQAISAIVVLYLLSGFYLVQTDEQAVIRRFGAVVGKTEPGMHWRLPFPFERVSKLKVRQTRRVRIGGELPDQVLATGATATSEFLTGDQNIINVTVTAQFTVTDPVAYLFRAQEVDALIARAAEFALAETVAGREVDALLTTGKVEASQRVLQETQRVANDYGLGVNVMTVSIETVQPPPEVAAAFRDVASARADRDRFINEADGYAKETVQLAKGEAAKMREEAEAYRTKKINEAIGDAARFRKLADEWRKAKEVTSQRLYLEAMEEILPKIKKLVVDSDGGKSPIDLSVIRAQPPEQGTQGGAGKQQ